MDTKTLHDTAAKMVAPGKGILAIDESMGTCEKRFDSIGVECTEENRRHYRQLLVTAPGMEEAISGYILFDETLRQSTDDGKTFASVLEGKGIMPGIKVDAGAKDMALFPEEKITEGLDGLRERLAEYKELGAKFAKWRAVIMIDTEKELPSFGCMHSNMHALARYAALCQEAGLVPMVEPEILLDGTHTMEQCQKVSEETWTALFVHLEKLNVDLAGTILKTSMVLPGKDSGETKTDDEIAEATVETFKKVIPEELAGIVFLSGGMSDAESTTRLNAMNKMYSDLPWPLSFSYGRGIQAPALELWGKDQKGNYDAAQKVLAHRARMNGLAAKGEYTEEAEKEA